MRIVLIFVGRLARPGEAFTMLAQRHFCRSEPPQTLSAADIGLASVLDLLQVVVCRRAQAQTDSCKKCGPMA